MKRFKSILVATDTRLNSHPIVEEAAEIARKHGASLKIVDVVPDFTRLARMFGKGHEDNRETVGKDKQEKLDDLASNVIGNGVEVESKVLWGKTSVEIIREVLRGQHDLVMRVAKGHNSRHKGFFGATGRRLLRDCPSAVWLVADAKTPDYKHVMGCIDTSTGHDLDFDLNSKICDLVSIAVGQPGAHVSIVHAWGMDGEELLAGRMVQRDFEELLDQRREYLEGLLYKFLESRGMQTGDSDIRLLKGDPAHAIPYFARQNEVDLIVMGTVARSGLLGLVIGNTAERILDDISCSVLAVKPDSFVSLVTERESLALTRRPEHAH